MTSRQPLSPMRKLRIFEAAGGICHICEQKIFGKEWDAEHVIPLALGGADDESNLRPAHKDCHASKTREDQGNIAKAKRMKAKHHGIRKPATMLGSRNSPLKKHMDGRVSQR